MSDEMKKVQTGDPFVIPPATYNRFVDAARASGTLRLGEPGGPGTAMANTVLAYNASGEDAPMGGICELADTGVSPNQVEFVKPGAATGEGVYGVLLEPIFSTKYGRIALDGGPWEVTGVGLSVGDLVGAEDGSWLAATDVPSFLQIVRDSVDGVAVAFFRRLQQIRHLNFAGAATLDIYGGSVYSRNSWGVQRGYIWEYEGGEGLLQFAYKVPACRMFAGAAQPSSSFHIDASGTLSGMWNINILVDAIVEPFDVASDSFAVLASLSTYPLSTQLFKMIWWQHTFKVDIWGWSDTIPSSYGLKIYIPSDDQSLYGSVSSKPLSANAWDYVYIQ